jgi:hypothetical protein
MADLWPFGREGRGRAGKEGHSKNRQVAVIASRTMVEESGAQDLKSFVLNGTCGFDPHPGHSTFLQ